MDAGSRFGRPCFRGYAFITVEAQWYAARWSLGVIGLIMDGIKSARVADHIIDDLRKRERNGLIELPKRPALQPGDQVRILQGPFAGHLGLYAGMRAHERVLVLLALLGCERPIELAKDAIEGV
jgi:transcriptional antiterminator RfaH